MTFRIRQNERKAKPSNHHIVYSSKKISLTKKVPVTSDLETPSDSGNMQTLDILHSRFDLIASPTICEQPPSGRALPPWNPGRIDQLLYKWEKVMALNFIELDPISSSTLVEPPSWVNTVKCSFACWVLGRFEDL